MGTLLSKMHQDSQALAYYRRAIRAAPGSPKPMHNYAVAMERAGNVDEAIRFYAAAANADPDDADSHFNLANLLLTAAHQPQLAVPQYASAVALRPNRADYRTNFAVALRAIGQIAEAKAQCQAALRIDPTLA